MTSNSGLWVAKKGGHSQQVVSLAKTLPWGPLAVLLGIVISAAFANVVTPHDPIEYNLPLAHRPPFWVAGGSASYPLGTDHMGRDILSRVIYGARFSVVAATSAVVISGTLGTVLGLISGYWGGRWDNLLMRLTDVQLAMPPILLALIFVGALGPGLTNVIIVIAITAWPHYARIVRSEVLSLKQRDFVNLAIIGGCGTPRILFAHMLPNVFNSLIILATLDVGRVIIFEASLSFLGMGVTPPTPSWGLMLAEARMYVSTSWWFSIFPGLAIFVAVIGVNLFGDWLRDALDPRRRQV